MNRLLLPAFCAAILTSHVQALTDINGNGLSDDWEKFFNNDQLFSPTNPDHAPGADPDGDGWTNLQEATAGTDPFDPHPPAGIIVPAIEITPATYEPLHEGSEPPPSTEPPPTDPFAPSTPAPPAPPRILLDPPEIRLTWHTIPGKTYRVILSADLLTWSPASDTYVGSGVPITYETVPLNEDGTIPEKLFWRVETGDTDTDGDTISDYEEILRGLNPFSTDTDGDGIPDTSIPSRWSTPYRPSGTRMRKTLPVRRSSHPSTSPRLRPEATRSPQSGSPTSQVITATARRAARSTAHPPRRTRRRTTPKASRTTASCALVCITTPSR